jgi:hypothetical protein
MCLQAILNGEIQQKKNREPNAVQHKSQKFQSNNSLRRRGRDMPLNVPLLFIRRRIREESRRMKNVHCAVVGKW